MQLTNYPGYNAETTIHPTEEKVIFTSLRDGDINLFEMDYNGENVIQITTEYGYDGGAFYSPEGDRIVWRAWYGSNINASPQKQIQGHGYDSGVPWQVANSKKD